jgi:hypothetical protein
MAAREAALCGPDTRMWIIGQKAAWILGNTVFGARRKLRKVDKSQQKLTEVGTT